MRFPLSDWIDAHPECRHNLASSGMRGAIPPPRWPRGEVDPAGASELQRRLAARLGVAPRRLVLGHGASEANGWVLGFLARRAGRSHPRLRVRLPEYPPLFDTGRALGYVLRHGPAPAEVAVVSRPRNPEGDLWSESALADWAEGTGALLVDETFREFVEAPSVARRGSPRVWATGSFTKFYGADDVRVGFAVAPPGMEVPFARYVGLVADELSPVSAAVALDLLERHDAVRRRVRAVVDRNLAALLRRSPALGGAGTPLRFDRLGRRSGTALARRCLRASVLVCPGRFFGEPAGVRLCLTRRDFPAALDAYWRVRDGREGA